jgi:hypothetical protein
MLSRMLGQAPTRTKTFGRPLLGILFLAAGVALFAWLVVRLDVRWGDVRGAFRAVGWWFAAILGLTLVRFALRTLAWMTLSDESVPFASALAATLSGDAIGNVMLVGVVASEPAKAVYLRRHGDPTTLLASLAAENFFYSVSVALYVIVASGAMLLLFDLDPRVHLWGTIALGSMATVLAGAAWVAWQQPAVASGMLGRLPFTRLQAFVERVRTFEQDSYGAAGPGGRRLAIVSGCEVGFHLLSLLECWLTFWLLTGVTAIVPALVFDGFNRVVNIVARPIPGRLGVEEGGTAILAGAIGYAPADGFLLVIVRKVRMIVFAAIGMALAVRKARA